MDRIKILQTNYKNITITNKTKENIIKHHKLNYRLPVKVFMGKFYTDDEYNQKIDNAFNTPLPGEEKRIQKVKSIFKRKK